MALNASMSSCQLHCDWLKHSDIRCSCPAIVEKMATMQTSTVSVNNDMNEYIYIKLCTRPNTDQENIFNALNFKSRHSNPVSERTKALTYL